jgi:multicomponent Na+:H+ antiporter subunit F
MTLEGVALLVAMPLGVVSFILALARLLRGPTLADRVVALDMLGIIAIALLAMYALATRQPAFVDVAVVVGLIGFLGTVAFARYVERR